MKRKIATLFAAIAITLLSWSCPQAQMITGSDGEKLRNVLEWTYWQGHGGKGHGGSGDGRCIYIRYASWCPHCKKLVPEVSKISNKVEVRWILCDAAPGSSFILSSAMPKAFADFIAGKKTRDSAVDRLVATYNANVFEAAKGIAPKGYPRIFLITNKGVRVVDSIAEAMQYEKEIAPSTTSPYVTYEELKRYAGLAGKPVRGEYYNNSGHDQYLRAIPDPRAPKVDILHKGKGFDTMGECRGRNGERWLAVPMWNNSMPLYLMPKE